MIVNTLRLLRLTNRTKKDHPNNYRPISVISIVGKIFERAIYNQLYAYLKVHNLFNNYQSAFRSTVATLQSRHCLKLLMNGFLI